MGKNNGYIFVWRQLRENPFYTNSKAIHIWLECLFRATYKERAIYKGREKIELDSGEFIMGYREFGETIDIGTSTVKYWMDKFEAERMIERKSNAKGTKVKVLNWDDYQDVERILERKSNGDETQVESNNKDNKDNSVDKTTKDKSDSKSDDPSEKYNDFAPTTSRGLDYEQIKELWNDRVPETLQIRTITDKRKRHLRARYKESDFALNDIINAIQEQPFLLGENDRGWVADFTWIIENQDHYTNILERKYKDAKFNGKTESEYIKEL